MEYPKEITAALHEVMSSVGYVQKARTNSFHNYKYAGEADLLEALRPAMLKAGLLLIPSGAECSVVDEFGNTFVAVDYTLAHKSGQVWPDKIRAFGCGNDKNKNGVGDKGVYKALTGANKYLLFKLFQIETGDDPENEAPPLPGGSREMYGTNGNGAAPQASKAEWKGPLKVTELKAKLRALNDDIKACSDGVELDAVITTYRPVIDQCIEDLPGWYFPVDKGHRGLQGLIEDRTAELNEQPRYEV